MADGPKKTDLDAHRSRLYFIASRIIQTRYFESSDFRVVLPKEGAALENMSYRDAEELLVRASDSYSELQVNIAQAKGAQVYLERVTKTKRDLLLGDPDFQGDAKNEAQRLFNVNKDNDYKQLMADLASADVAVAYLERLAAAALETLQVVKKIRDAALSRKERDENWARSQSGQH